MKAETRSRFYNEMRLARLLTDESVLAANCSFEKPSIICSEQELKARVVWRELMSEVSAIEIALGF